MPRKVSKTAKPPLLFRERPVCGAKLQNVPEIRAALNPRDFFTETTEQNSSTLNSWVSPQFDSSLPALPPVRRGRRKCQSTTSILDTCSQLSRKNSVCKFPSLAFQTGSRVPKSTHTKKATERTDAGNQPQGLCQNKRTVSSGQHLDTPKRQLVSIRKKNAKTFCDSAASHRKCMDQPDSASVPGGSGASTPDLDIGSVAPPPDVDTPKAVEDGASGPSTSSVHFLLAQTSCTPPSNQPPVVLVADTPERDYGVKVTWRRRKDLMLLLKDRGHLSESDVLIHS